MIKYITIRNPLREMMACIPQKTKITLMYVDVCLN